MLQRYARELLLKIATDKSNKLYKCRGGSSAKKKKNIVVKRPSKILSTTGQPKSAATTAGMMGLPKVTAKKTNFQTQRTTVVKVRASGGTLKLSQLGSLGTTPQQGKLTSSKKFNEKRSSNF